MTRPDPKSFTTLESAQAEIARLNVLLDRAETQVAVIAHGAQEARDQVTRLLKSMGVEA